MLRRAAVGRIARGLASSRAPIAVALFVGLAVASACAKSPPPPPGPPPSCRDEPGARPRFDPATLACDCAPAEPLAWQAAAPRPGEPVREKEPARIALRRAITADFQEKDVEAVVVSERDVAASATGALSPPEWVLLEYPQDFPLGAAHRAGVYTVLWKVDGAVVACDGFVIEEGER